MTFMTKKAFVRAASRLTGLVGSRVSLYSALKSRPPDDSLAWVACRPLKEATLFPLRMYVNDRRWGGKKKYTYDVVVEFSFPMLCHPNGEEERSSGSTRVSMPSSNVCFVMGRTVYWTIFVRI